MNANRTLTTKPALEALEDRFVPTTASISNGILYVQGTNAPETIRVTQSGTRITVEGVGYVNAADVRGVNVDAKGGNDTIDVRTVKVGATIAAGDGDDMVIGTQAADVVFA